MDKPKVLFLCTGNSARSQMAEALLRFHAGDRFEVRSAGIEPKGFILPEVVEALKERGVNVSGQTSKSVKEFLGKVHFAYVVTVCADAEENCPAVFLNMGKHEHWPFDDPARASDENRLDVTRKVRGEIEQRILQWLAEQEK